MQPVQVLRVQNQHSGVPTGGDGMSLRVLAGLAGVTLTDGHEVPLAGSQRRSFLPTCSHSAVYCSSGLYNLLLALLDGCGSGGGHLDHGGGVLHAVNGTGEPFDHL